MEVQGKIIAALTPRSGESRRNPGEQWMSQDFVVEVPGQYPRKMVFTVFGSDRLQRFNIQTGQFYSVNFDIDAHEWNGKWFNDIRAYDVHLVDQAAAEGNGAAPFAPQNAPFPPQPATQAAAPQADPFAAAQNAAPASSQDDLPF